MRFCSYCGKEIADEAVICLNCGCMVQNTTPFRAARSVAEKPQVIVKEMREPALAVAARICGCISLFIGWLVLGVTAIVLACMSKEETNGEMCPSARIGFICGIVSTVLSFILIPLLVLLIMGYI